MKKVTDYIEYYYKEKGSQITDLRAFFSKTRYTIK